MSMKPNMKRAFKALQKIGAPVFDHGEKDSFTISGEDNYDRIWANYYDYQFGEFGVCREICDLLQNNGLFPEWQDPGTLKVYQL